MPVCVCVLIPVPNGQTLMQCKKPDTVASSWLQPTAKMILVQEFCLLCVCLCAVLSRPDESYKSGNSLSPQKLCVMHFVSSNQTTPEQGPVLRSRICVYRGNFRSTSGFSVLRSSFATYNQFIWNMTSPFLEEPSWVWIVGLFCNVCLVKLRFSCWRILNIPWRYQYVCERLISVKFLLTNYLVRFFKYQFQYYCIVWHGRLMSTSPAANLYSQKFHNKAVFVVNGSTVYCIQHSWSITHGCYTRFDLNNPVPATCPCVDGEAATLTLEASDISGSFQNVDQCKAHGLDGNPGYVLRVCADKLAKVLTNIFNLSLSQSVVPTPFKASINVPVPKKPVASCLNHYSPVALTSVIMKCFERLVQTHICSSLPEALDPLQFAYRLNRSTDYAIALATNTALTHLDKRNTYVRMLFVDYSSAFNTIIPSKLDSKLIDLDPETSIWSWIYDFLTGRPHMVRTGSHISSQLIPKADAPQPPPVFPVYPRLHSQAQLQHHH